MQGQMGQPRQQRRGRTGQIADFLQSGLGAYLMQKDMGQQQAAQQAFATGAKGGDLKGAMTALEGLSGNPYAQNRLQNLLMRQIGQSQKEKQRLKERESERETYKFQQEHKAFAPTKLVPGRDVPYAPEVQEQRLAGQQAKRTSWGPAPGRPGMMQSSTGELKAMPQTAEQQFQEKLKLQKAGIRAKPLTVNQANAGLYADRMSQANAILSDPAILSASMSRSESALASVPFVGNELISAQFQQSEQAKRDFINAVLRRESGAAIADTEFASADKQYFPQRGDSKEVIDQKIDNRQTAIKGIARAAGPGYRSAVESQPQQVSLGAGEMGQIPSNIAAQPELSIPQQPMIPAAEAQYADPLQDIRSGRTSFPLESTATGFQPPPASQLPLADVAQISSEAEYNVLPSGALYSVSGGKAKRKR